MTSFKIQEKRKLPRLTNREYDYVATLCRNSGIPISQCPTCLAKKVEIEDGVWGWVNGTYRYRGVEWPCDCDRQIALRIHYLLANIGDQYQRLNWDDFTGDPSVTDEISIYLERWQSMRLNGMGMEFSSPSQGVGKTFAATTVGKELVKAGEAVFFIPFLDVINLLGKDNVVRNETEERLRATTVLILDEVRPAVSAAQRDLFGGKFEELIRHRTNFNLPTIMTTNLRPDELHEEYPRTYSLLEAKQIRVEMAGADARQTSIANENIELALNNEVRPIT